MGFQRDRLDEPPAASAGRIAAAESPQPCDLALTAEQLCDIAMVAVALAFAVPLNELVAATRSSSRVARARQSAMYVAHVNFGLKYSEIGLAFGRDRTTAAHACRVIEQQRDDRRIDAVLGTIESACRMLCGRLAPAVLR